MRVKVARRIGFCFGVKRAIHMACDALRAHRPNVYSLGSVIHNPQVVERLSKRGLTIIKDLQGVREGAVLISSHGAPPGVTRGIREKGLILIDTTCPFVLLAQRLVREMAQEGYRVIIVGEKAHPEVKALVGFASGKAIVVKNVEEARRKNLGKGTRAAVISQTTQAMANYRDVVSTLLRKRPREIRVFNTICDDTGKRQESAEALAKTVDVMVVIGGRHSANTNRLYEVCRKSKTSYFVETERDVDASWFTGTRTVGVASGASTPEWVIKKVVARIKKIQEKGDV